ncbi:hypothetical protein E9840_11535 [Tissierella creatinini]|nr:hypothetical protein E9840_11535 [Tissierella creatinini]TJX61077.1 hypothetical protein E8P77_18850 [Soehngenia saccharolytica]
MNLGFETGDLSEWVVTSEADDINVITGDSFVASPYWGDYMAVLGTPGAGGQPIGDNTIKQEFFVDFDKLVLAYNLHSNDYGGFDKFMYEVTVVSDGEVLDTLLLHAGSADGIWHEVEVDLSAYHGETIELIVTAGGTSDTLYGTWAYFDMSIE